MRIQTAASHQITARLRVGLLSDTHNLLRPEVEAFLQGCDHIIHAGDICEPGVLERLECIAPVTAVRGNNDIGPWAEKLKETELIRVGGINISAIHNIAELDLAELHTDIQVVVFGHSHKPVAENRNGILYINPGSAGPRRFKLLIAAAELVIENGNVAARHHYFS
jgi:putative phosphoesterase